MEIRFNEMFNNIISCIDLDNKPNLFLHVCCGPCSSAVFKKIINFFNVYVIFYNSNIDSKNEFDLRFEQLKKVIDINKYNIKVIYSDYIHDEFLNYVIGYEKYPEGGPRCSKCFELRLKMSCDIASKYIVKHNLTNFKNYLCTTLSISPHKNSSLIVDIGNKICKNSECNLEYLPSDFKKENGFLDSIELSKQYGLYRQNYCGCEFAKYANI